ncbi:MAG TPA: TatD family deoxyribonuclease [Planctomycetaceae bacterium]|nr:TatD family deoxyribonuclease [Planctomycetaceae bacterium]HIQ21435.1 TatD family deoxyribonuclease [Planctomycetota bacterium]
MSYIDTHAHLDLPEFDEDRDAVLMRARQAGVEAVICPGIEAESSRAAVELAERYEDVFAAVGIQPNYGAQAGPDAWPHVTALAEHPKAVAIGETGLDRHWDFTPFDLQREYFRRHLQLAQKLDRPVIVHCREAEAEVLEMLDEATGSGPVQGVMHAFSGGPELAEACLERGMYVSFAGAVTYRNKKFQGLHQAARLVPADRLLVETDSPYLVPHPLRGKLKRNEPRQIVHTAAWLAQLRGEDAEALAARCAANARRLFRLPAGR